ncbi:hypothetical protein HDU76_010986 [Blyttiomyces sp. JEL0837]|nr:hypothetical protein HDU76_010986 [Blyttiomyces sp. JEL0837]
MVDNAGTHSTPYAVLGIPPNATQVQARAAQVYLRLAKLCHPDKLGPNSDDSQFKSITAAYEEIVCNHGRDYTQTAERSDGSNCDDDDGEDGDRVFGEGQRYAGGGGASNANAKGKFSNGKNGSDTTNNAKMKPENGRQNVRNESSASTTRDASSRQPHETKPSGPEKRKPWSTSAWDFTFSSTSSSLSTSTSPFNHGHSSTPLDHNATSTSTTGTGTGTTRTHEKRYTVDTEGTTFIFFSSPRYPNPQYNQQRDGTERYKPTNNSASNTINTNGFLFQAQVHDDDSNSVKSGTSTIPPTPPPSPEFRQPISATSLKTSMSSMKTWTQSWTQTIQSDIHSVQERCQHGLSKLAEICVKNRVSPSDTSNTTTTPEQEPQQQPSSGVLIIEALDDLLRGLQRVRDSGVTRSRRFNAKILSWCIKWSSKIRNAVRRLGMYLKDVIDGWKMSRFINDSMARTTPSTTGTTTTIQLDPELISALRDAVSDCHGNGSGICAGEIGVDRDVRVLIEAVLAGVVDGGASGNHNENQRNKEGGVIDVDGIDVIAGEEGRSWNVEGDENPSRRQDRLSSVPPHPSNNINSMPMPTREAGIRQEFSRMKSSAVGGGRNRNIAKWFRSKRKGGKGWGVCEADQKEGEDFGNGAFVDRSSSKCQRKGRHGQRDSLDSAVLL